MPLLAVNSLLVDRCGVLAILEFPPLWQCWVCSLYWQPCRPRGVSAACGILGLRCLGRRLCFKRHPANLAFSQG